MKRAFAVALSCLLVGLPGSLAAAEQVLLLDVRLNGRAIGKIGEFTLVDGKLFLQRSEVRELGLKLPDRVAAGPDDRIALATLPGVTYRLDLASQTIALTAANDRIIPMVLLPGEAGPSQVGRVESGTGATFDYDMTATSQGGHLSAAGLLDMRVFSPWGVASTGVLANIGGRGSTVLTRLDTTYTLSDPATLRRIRLGDFVSGSLAWTRPVRLGGAQLSLDFGLRP
ncbi:MAG: fimbria/pilus outer membrane usher protein, partial [Janthinobacterium lividum]